jgi:glycogen phosphorylase
MQRIDRFLRRTHIAYFTMEIALRDEIHTFSGGLGVLAGDTARSSADLELPIVFVSLMSRQGYVRQEIDAEGRQRSFPNPWDPRKWMTPLGAMVVVPIEGRDVWVRPWLYVVESPLGGRVPVLLLDTDVEQNTVEDRKITDTLYGGDEVYRLKQEIVLGIGGAQVLQALGFAIRMYHLNEGHAAFLTLYLLRRLRQPEQVRERCIFTTHTPVEAGHDKFAYKLFDQSLHGYVEARELKALAGSDKLNMTQLALNLSGFVNGVARKHAEVTRKLFPGYHIHAVTNGVHVQTWAHPNFARLFQEKFPNWAHEPEMLVHADQFADTAVWEAHQGAKHDLVALVKQRCGVELRPDVPIIGYAQRMTGYKRPELIFSDMKRLAAIARQWPFQLVFSGIAHPNDGDGKKGIEQVHAVMRKAGGDVPIAFIPGYNMKVAGALVAGADVWLNNPMPPLEASGTSGMKAAVNGVLNFSVLDGWWLEAWVEGATGWAIGDTHDPGIDHAAELYRKLGGTVLPLYHKDRARWIWMMKQAIKIGAYFNSQRMMRRYASEAYVR